MLKNKDGIIEELYYILWKKQDYLKDAESLYDLDIPDTVIIKFNIISNWYFTSKEGKLKRKNKISLTREAVYDTFSVGNERSGITSYFMSSPGAADDASKK